MIRNEAMKPETDIIIRDDRWEAAIPHVSELCDVAAIAAFAASAIQPPHAEASLVLADDDFVASLNEQYRDREGPTNVLSFASYDDVDELRDLPDGMPAMLGDIIIAFDTTEREAQQSGIDLDDHLRHLVVHGMLHLLGYDHISDDQAAMMEPLETKVLAQLGVTDPYNSEVTERINA
jgi:probable rRNA maturation factor